MIFCIEKKAAV